MTDKYLNRYNIKFLVVHCSDTDDKENLLAKDIHEMHLNFGWNGIGYHKVICRNGTIENGRPEYWTGAHARGFNDKSLGVCMIGRKNFTDKQFSSLKNVLMNWKNLYPLAEIIGHEKISDTNKTCPNFDVISWCKSVNLS